MGECCECGGTYKEPLGWVCEQCGDVLLTLKGCEHNERVVNVRVPELKKRYRQLLADKKRLDELLKMGGLRLVKYKDGMVRHYYLHDRPDIDKAMEEPEGI